MSFKNNNVRKHSLKGSYVEVAGRDQQPEGHRDSEWGDWGAQSWLRFRHRDPVTARWGSGSQLTLTALPWAAHGLAAESMTNAPRFPGASQAQA